MAMMFLNVCPAKIYREESFLSWKSGNWQISGKLGYRMSANDSNHTPLQWHIALAFFTHCSFHIFLGNFHFPQTCPFLNFKDKFKVGITKVVIFLLHICYFCWYICNFLKVSHYFFENLAHLWKIGRWNCLRMGGGSRWLEGKIQKLI